jgi:PleD family two-component response regulator
MSRDPFTPRKREDTGRHRLESAAAAKQAENAAESIAERCAAIVKQVRSQLPVVLIVEDDPHVMSAYERELAEIAYIVSAINKKEALRAIHEIHPDLVILDLVLPDGSGMDILRDLREIPGGRHIRVLIISAYIDENMTILAERLGGPVELIHKGDADALGKALRRHGKGIDE